MRPGRVALVVAAGLALGAAGRPAGAETPGGAAVGAAAAPAQRTVPAPLERVWAAAEAVLEREGWGIDHADRTAGVLVSKSHRLAGDDRGLQATTRRLRLRVRVAPAAGGTTVTVEREVFARERVLWVEREAAVVLRDALVPADTGLERRLLAAIGEAARSGPGH